MYACSHLANSASLLLPVSNLTNLLAFTACGVSFTRFAALMALPWLVAIAVEWLVLSRVFADDLRQPRPRRPRRRTAPAPPAFALTVVALTLVGFGISSIVAWRRCGSPPPARWRSRCAAPRPVTELLARRRADVPGVRARPSGWW